MIYVVFPLAEELAILFLIVAKRYTNSTWCYVMYMAKLFSMDI